MSSLEPCESYTQREESPLTTCGAVALATSADSTTQDASSEIVISQDCKPSCTLCPPKAAIRGLCAPGNYSYTYTVRGTDQTATRWLAIEETATVSVDLLFLPEGTITADVLSDIEVRTGPQGFTSPGCCSCSSSAFPVELCHSICPAPCLPAVSMPMWSLPSKVLLLRPIRTMSCSVIAGPAVSRHRGAAQGRTPVSARNSTGCTDWCRQWRRVLCLLLFQHRGVG